MISRRFRSLSVLIPLSVALAACGGKDPTKDGHPAPPDIASDFSGPIDGHGVMPNWSLRIRGTQLTVSRDGQADLTGVSPGAEITPHAATWTAKLPNGQSMTAKLYGSSCVDTASSQSYPMSVEMDLPSESPLSGCAGPAAGATAAPATTPAKTAPPKP